jgi:hypothetical protein
MKTLTDCYRDQILDNPESNLYLAFYNLYTLLLEEEGTIPKANVLGEGARELFEGEEFLDIGFDTSRADLELLAVSHSLVDWTYLATCFLRTRGFDV